MTIVNRQCNNTVLLQKKYLNIVLCFSNKNFACCFSVWNFVITLGKFFPAAPHIRQHVVIAPTFVVFRSSSWSPGLTSGSSRALIGRRGNIRNLYTIDKGVKGSMMMITFLSLYMHQQMQHESLLNLKGVMAWIKQPTVT
jgi:hypothetical protein